MRPRNFNHAVIDENPSSSHTASWSNAPIASVTLARSSSYGTGMSRLIAAQLRLMLLAVWISPWGT
jgi:hypothetical protein